MKKKTLLVLLAILFSPFIFLRIFHVNSSSIPSPILPTGVIAQGSSITVTGTVTCLPHKDTKGPQTLECAFGIKADDGKYYGVYDPTMQYVTTLSNGKKVTIKGNLDTSAVSKSQYPIEGAITVTTLTQ